MPSAKLQPPTLKLSICITTFNRGALIGAALESILAQLTSNCEVLVLDGGSTDDTERVLSEYARCFDRLRYIKQKTNNGIDRDYDRVVELANGEYCWLMTDDDMLKPGAIAAVLQALRRNLALTIVNAEARDFSMSKVQQSRILDFTSDRVYGPEEMDRLVCETGDILRYIGCFVIKRTIWLARERQRYYGSLFINLGVIFQERLPGETLVIAEPFVSYRMGNAHTWKAVETFMVNLPSLVESLALSEAAKSKICSAKPWRDSQELLWLRGLGFYSLSEYHRWIRPQLHSIRETLTPTFIALLPGVLVNALFLFYYSVTRRRYRGVWQPELVLQGMKDSRFYFRNWRVFKRES